MNKQRLMFFGLVAALCVCLVLGGKATAEGQTSNKGVEHPSAKSLFEEAKAVIFTDKQKGLELYDQLISTYPESEYTPEALLETLAYILDFKNIEDVPFFAIDELIKVSDKFFTMNLFGGGRLRSITAGLPFKYSPKERAELLYFKHRDFLEQQNGFYWTLIYKAGLKEQAYPFLLKKAFEEKPVNSVVAYYAASYLIEQNEYEQAISLLDSFLEAEKSAAAADVYLMKAWLLLEQDETDLATSVALKAQEVLNERGTRVGSGAKQLVQWFLPEEETCKLKIGVFVNGIPVEHTPVTVRESSQLQSVIEVRATKENGYTGTFTRPHGEYDIWVHFNSEQGLKFNRSDFYVTLKGKNNEPIKSLLPTGTVTLLEDYQPGTDVTVSIPYLVLEPSEELILEFHIQAKLDLELQADKTVYLADEAVMLTWKPYPKARYYKLELRSGEDLFTYNVSENSIELNEELVDEITDFNNGGLAYISKDNKLYLNPASLVGYWRGYPLEVRVYPLNIEPVTDETKLKSLIFPRYFDEEPFPVTKPLTLYVNPDSLEAWEREITRLPISKAYFRFQEIFSKDMLAKSPRLEVVFRRLKKAYEQLQKSL